MTVSKDEQDLLNPKRSRYSKSWCPCCKYWVPEDKLQKWIADSEDTPFPRPIQVGQLVRMCQNCLESTSGNPYPVFNPETLKLIYDPYHESIKCPFCEGFNVEPRKDAPKEEADIWKCQDCGELVYIGR